MPTDHIRYDILAQEALRGLVRRVLTDVAKNGLPGEHHFFITFETDAPGVKLSPRLREQYPEQMTVVMQHQFWDLKVGDEVFEVGMSFGGVPERLVIPFAAIRAFADPSVQFALQFEELAETDEAEEADETPSARPRTPAEHPARKPVLAPVAANPETGSEAAGETSDTPVGEKSGAEVVRLDRFRKK